MSSDHHTEALLPASLGSLLTADELNDRSFLKGKVVLITGCTNGLGAAILDQMLSLTQGGRPKKLILVARNAELVAKKAILCKNAGVEASTYLAELTDVKQIFRVANEVYTGEVKIDILCLNAGMFKTDNERIVQADNLEQHYVANFLQQVIFAQTWGPMLPPGGRVCVMGSFTSFAFSKGVLDFEHLGTKEGEHKLIINQAIPYSQSKLMQHMWAKHVAFLAPLGENVSINVVCPGSVMTAIDTWQNFKNSVACCYPCCKVCVGIREPPAGATSMMFAVGSHAVDGITGNFVDFGNDTQAIVPYKPCDLEFYPSQKKWTAPYCCVAPSTADPAQCERLYNETNAKIAELRAKYAL